jgi:uncharacterized membrane protein
VYYFPTGGQKYCRNCGKEVAGNMATCPVCGVNPASGQSFCPACGGQTNELTQFCLKCGTRLQASPVVENPHNYENVPIPGVLSSYKHGWSVLWPNFAMLLLIFIIYAAISGASAIPLVGTVFIVIPLEYGYAYVFLRTVRKEKFDVEHVFSGFQNYWNSVKAGVLVLLIIFGGLILLIVPGIVFACKLAFVPYLVVDRKMAATEAIKESWRMTGGQAMKVFGIGLLGFLLAIAGLICFLVGVIVAEMWIESAMASLYFAVSEHPEKSETVQLV